MAWAKRAAAAIVGALLGAAALAAPVPPKAEPAIWTIQKPNGATIAFFGSVHLLPDGKDWRTKALAAAYDAADVIVLETDLSVMGEREMQAYLAKNSTNPSGVRLSKLLDAEQRAAVATAAEAAGLSLRALERYQPWFAALQISVGYAISQGFDPSHGVDKQIESDGRADGKAIAYFEKTREQLDLFIDLPQDEQISFLTLGSQEIIDRPNELKDLIGAWARGDVETIDELMNRGLEGSPLLQKALLEDRNARWVKVIREFFLKDKNSYLIVVGAGHLAGDDGVIEMLRDEGVEVVGP